MPVGKVQAKEDWELFGTLPSIRSLDVSPNGNRLALLKQIDAKTFLAVYDLSTGKMIGGVDARKFKARSVRFVSDNHVVIRASRVQRLIGYRVNKIEDSNAFIFNVDENKVKLLLRGSKGISPVQTGLGRISGVSIDLGYLYMPAFATGIKPGYNLYRVNIKTGRASRHRRGKNATDDWIMGDDGSVLAREDYLHEEQLHRVYAYGADDKTKLIYESKTSRPDIWVVAATPDKKSLLVKTSDDGSLRHMSLLDGSLSEPIYTREDTQIDEIITDDNRQLVAIVYSGLRRKYKFVDTELGVLFSRVEATFPNAMVDYVSATPDKRFIVVKVGGSETPPAYYLFDSKKVQLSLLGRQYPEMTNEDVGVVKAFTYSARDGLKIPALLTLPSKNSGVERLKMLPLIAFPHGGPAAYDSFGFDWWAQYFANQGYAVLQPNFRGSDGFGGAFEKAGEGKWGREMQDDVSDGVLHLIEKGIADPERVCIMGASYGGYSALAGGAFSPELYRCVVSVNGVADLPRKLVDNKTRYGADHWAVRYWKDIMNDGKVSNEHLKKISPAHHANKFTAPVLLVHGRDDVVVPFRQSQRMQKALKKSGKKVELVSLKGEDHWLSSGDTRKQTLKAIDDFMKKHNPPG
jgi:dipeptidyl aminopeptidase/acylaminoacyl peptidase